MTAWIYFTDSDNRLLSFFLKRGFQHCFVVLYTPNASVLIDPTVDNINITVESVEEYGRDWAYALPVHVKEDAEFGMFGLHSCVSYVKRVIGLNKWWIITPYQLFKELRRGNV